MKSIFLIISTLVIYNVLNAQSVDRIIEGQLKEKYKLDYFVSGKYYIDSLKDFNRGIFTEEDIVDPYGTLAKSYVFITDKNSDESKYVVGVFRENNVVWVSDTLFVPVDRSFISKLYGTYDINCDGKVELMFVWTNPSVHTSIMYIFSWDGVSGKRINRVEASEQFGGEEESVINDVFFTLVDFNGDGFIEINCSYKDDESNLYNQTWSWNGYEYGNWTNTPEMQTTPYTRKFASANVTARMRKIKDNYEYSYNVQNDLSSKRRINLFAVATNVKDMTGDSLTNDHWSYSSPLIDTDYYLWVPIEFESRDGYRSNGRPYPKRKLLGVGHELNGLNVTCKYLPGINKFYVQSEGFIDVDYYHESFPLSMDEDVKTNSTSGYTISPNKIDSPYAPVNHLDSLINYSEKSFELGWIKEQSVNDKYKGYLSSSKDFIQQKNSAEARKYLQSILQDVDKDSSFSLSSEAYALLRYNTEYILSSLPETFKLNININGNGSIEKNPSQTEYDSSSAVALSAKPSGGNKFAGWSGDVTSSSDTINLVMNSIKNITAKFIPDIMPVGITSLSPGSGIEGAKALTLEIKGYGFLNSTVLSYNGIQRQIAFLSDSAIALVLNQSDLNRPGSMQLNAVNIDGGNSNTIVFRILSKTEASDTLISKLNKANETGQIKSKGTFNSLMKKLESFKKDFEKKNMNSAASATLKAFLNELEAQAGKAISETASDELKIFADLILQSL